MDPVGTSFTFVRAPALRWSLLVTTWFGLVLTFFNPAEFALDGKLDPSIFSAYAYYTAKGFQFGPEVVAMAGPLGFVMYGNFYAGELYWTRFFAELIAQGIFSALLLWFMFHRARRTWARILWIGSHVLLSTLLADLTVAWSMLLAGLFLLSDRPRTAGSRALEAAVAITLGVFALFKGTHMTLSLATIAVVAAAWLLRRDPRQAGFVFTSYVSGLVGGLLATGQNPGNLPSYIKGVLDLTAGYNSAMSVEESASVLIRGASMAVGLGMLLSVAAWRKRRDPMAVGTVALMSGYTFVMWKHGFIRADAHVLIFFHFAVVATVAWAILFIESDHESSRPAQFAATGAVVALLVAGLAGGKDPQLPAIRDIAGRLIPHLRARVDQFIDPIHAHQSIEALLHAQRELNNLPRIRETVASSSVDFFGTRQGLLLLNRLNYRPRPMGAGSFNVYNRALMERNRDFLRDPDKRPAFYVLKPDSIDHRFVTQDDALALYEILHRYRPVLVESMLLLESAPQPIEPPEPVLIERQSFRFGERVSVPALRDDQLLLTRFVIEDSLMGRLRSAVYKVPPIEIELSDPAGTPLVRRRLVPPMAEVPFLFSPFIETLASVLDCFDQSPGIRPASFTLSTHGEGFFRKSLVVEFYVAPRPAPLDPIALSGLRSELSFRFANAVPEHISPAFREDPLVRYLHAPSEVVWRLDGHEREFSFQYGLAPESYLRGNSNGVEFIVEIVGPSGGRQRLFARTLRPLTSGADRSVQRARVSLPLYVPGSRLVLRTDPSEYGDNAWDWSYVSRMELKQARFTADQFPGFSPLPDEGAAEFASTVDLDGQKVVVLHVPGTVGFLLEGDERQLELDFGFLPGAYENGGNTPGADFVVQLIDAAGTTQEVFRRALRPVAIASDRGRQSSVVELPPLRAGDRLRLKTEAAAGAGNSWGWTYISRLHLRD